MNGPDHYAKSEELLARCKETEDPVDKARFVAKAQVHATLALAAATAINTLSGPQYHAWHEVANQGLERTPRPE